MHRSWGPLERIREKFSAKHCDFESSQKRLQHAINREYMAEDCGRVLAPA